MAECGLCHPPVLAQVWWHNPARWLGAVGMSVLTVLLELVFTAADTGLHSLELLPLSLLWNTELPIPAPSSSSRPISWPESFGTKQPLRFWGERRGIPGHTRAEGHGQPPAKKSGTQEHTRTSPVGTPQRELQRSP